MSNKLEVLKSLINDGGKATFATLLGRVEEKLLKTNNSLKNSLIEKEMVYNVQLNCNYQNSVNNRREKEGQERDFISKENWFEKQFDGFNGSIVKHKKVDKFYLMFICKDTKLVNYYVDGNIATVEQMDIIKNFKPKQSKPLNQGIEDNVIVRTISLDNIIELKTNGMVCNF
jgi:hypothetical protein